MVAAVGLWPLVPAHAQSSPAPVRVFGPSIVTKAPPKAGPATVRARTVRPDLGALVDLAARHAASKSVPRVLIDLFPGLELQGAIVHAQTRPTGATLFVRLDDVALGTAVFTVEAGVLTATIDFPGGSYVVSPQRGPYHDVAQKASQLFPAERTPRADAAGTLRTAPPVSSITATPAPPAGSGRSLDAPTDSGRLIDIMIVWTPAAQSAAGGLAAIQNLAQAAVDSANAAYLNSGIAQRLRLVHRQQVTYGERSNCAGGNAFDCALDDITAEGDGYMDDVHVLRDQHGADLVALFIHNSSYCGLAWLPWTPSPDLGFSITAHACAVGNKSFAHEVGHNMGAHHDPSYADAAGPKPYNRGYISPQLDWRTVMSYPGACGGCARVAFFSNPKLTFDGAAMGTPGLSNNAQVLNTTGKAIAAYRTTSPLHPVPQRFDDVPRDAPMFGDIEFFAQAEMTSGCAPGLYCPDAPVTRRQMAAFIERASRASNWTPPTASSTFDDVVEGSPFAGHIEALRNDGITLGCTSSTYCPESSVTRAQMSVFVLRARCGANYAPAAPSSPTFADVPLSHPFASYIEKMHALGITEGCATSPTRFCPDSTVSRAQIAAFIQRAYPFLTPSESCAP